MLSSPNVRDPTAASSDLIFKTGRRARVARRKSWRLSSVHIDAFNELYDDMRTQRRSLIFWALSCVALFLIGSPQLFGAKYNMAFLPSSRRSAQLANISALQELLTEHYPPEWVLLNAGGTGCRNRADRAVLQRTAAP